MEQLAVAINQKYISKVNSIDYSFNLFGGSGLKAQSINKKWPPSENQNYVNSNAAAGKRRCGPK